MLNDDLTEPIEPPRIGFDLVYECGCVGTHSRFCIERYAPLAIPIAAVVALVLAVVLGLSSCVARSCRDADGPLYMACSSKCDSHVQDPPAVCVCSTRCPCWRRHE